MPSLVHACKLTSRLRTRCLAASLGRVIVQENFRMGKRHQQRFFLCQRKRKALVQLLVATALPKEVLKLPLQRLSLLLVGIVPIGHKLAVELPEAFFEGVQELAMIRDAWDQFLVVAIFMNPAQG